MDEVVLIKNLEKLLNQELLLIDEDNFMDPDYYDINCYASNNGNVVALRLFEMILSEDILKIICNLQHLISLDLDNNQLTKIPNSIANLTKLKVLYLNSNQLSDIPDSIANLSNITSLYLSSNQFSKLPDPIIHLSSLERLSLHTNQISKIPDSISKLSNLQELNLSSNKLPEIPNSIGNLPNLKSLYLSANQISEIPNSITELSNLQELNLHSNQLSVIPNSITELSNLQELNIHSNQISEIPNSIGSLLNLKSLYLGANQISEIPDSTSKLSNLERLSLHTNQISEIPDSMTELSNLEVLNLSSNQISKIPDSITKLSNLQDLNLSSNKLSEIPNSIGSLSNLKELNLNSNQLSVIPDSIANLSNLKEFRMENNRISNLPTSINFLINLHILDLDSNQIDEFPEAIRYMKNLTTLYLSDNILSYLPNWIGELTNLETLHLRSNQLKELPESIGNLSQLQFLLLHSNQLTRLPYTLENLNLINITLDKNNFTVFLSEIQNEGGQELINYILKAQENGTPLNEAKLLIVGNERVGKTSLVNVLTNQNYNTDELSTEGININGFLSDNNIKLNIWDFAGQEITHQTHQFFLTARSLYLLVLDAQKEDDDTNIYHWLKTIKINSENAPIIVVVNQIDKNKNFRFDEFKYKREFNIVEVCYVSAAQNTNIDYLKSIINNEVEKIKEVKKIFPQKWFDVKSKIEEMAHEGFDYIETSNYKHICSEYDIIDKSDQTNLLKILNQIGTVVSYSEKRLDVTQILNPTWVTNGVYKIIRSGKLKDNNAVLNQSHFYEIFNGDVKYEDHYIWLIDLLQQFELAFYLNENEVLIPSALLPNEPEFNLVPYQKLNFRLEYELLKNNIISRFIVKIKKHIDTTKQIPYWKNGVFLRTNNCEAVVIASSEKKCIDIHINTNEQEGRSFLGIIRNFFRDINDDKYNVKEKVHLTLPEHKNQFIEYTTLLELEKKGIEENYFGNPISSYNIEILLNGYRIYKNSDYYETLTRDILHISELLLDQRFAIMQEDEDMTNDRYKGMLQAKHYKVSDQSRGGESGTGKSPGERDLVIKDERDTILSIIEAFQLKKYNSTTIISHYEKLVARYDTQGNKRNFIIIYSKYENFNDLWQKYKASFSSLEEIHSNYTTKLNILIGKTLEVDGKMEVYHFFINFYSKQSI